MSMVPIPEPVTTKCWGGCWLDSKLTGADQPEYAGFDQLHPVDDRFKTIRL